MNATETLLSKNEPLLEELLMIVLEYPEEYKECEKKLENQQLKFCFGLLRDNLVRYMRSGDFQPSLPEDSPIYKFAVRFIAKYGVRAGYAEPPRSYTVDTRRFWTVSDFDVLFQNRKNLTAVKKAFRDSGLNTNTIEIYFKFLNAVIDGEDVKEASTNKTLVYYAKIMREDMHPAPDSAKYWTASRNYTLANEFLLWTQTHRCKDIYCYYWEFAQSTEATTLHGTRTTENIANQMRWLHIEDFLEFDENTKHWIPGKSVQEAIGEVVAEYKNREIMEFEEQAKESRVPETELSREEALKIRARVHKENESFEILLKALCLVFGKKITVYRKNPRRVFIDVETTDEE